MQNLKQDFIEQITEYINNRMHPQVAKIQSIDSSVRFSLKDDINPSVLEEYIKHNRLLSFSETLLNFIDERGLKDSEVYKSAGINRAHFNKIKNDRYYHPGKAPVIALALALQLNINDTEMLLMKAGYSLADNNKSDLIVRYCIEHEIYEIYEINKLLQLFDQETI